VREALKLLEAEGYVTGDSYRGACVAPFDESASEEVLELRLLLESRLTRATAEKVTAQDITELRALADEFEQAFNIGDRAAARGVNYRFHRRVNIVSFAGSSKKLMNCPTQRNYQSAGDE
jgi:DNA-binding GntR family transcriptional regulator